MKIEQMDQYYFTVDREEFSIIEQALLELREKHLRSSKEVKMKIAYLLRDLQSRRKIIDSLTLERHLLEMKE